MPNANDTVVADDAELENIEATLAALRERANALTLEATKLEKFVKAARGSRDVTKEAAAARALTLPEQIEVELRRQIMTTEALARAIGAPAASVVEALKSVRRRVADIGTQEQARWTWRLVEGQATTEEVRVLVERLITDQPMTFQDLVRATGLREGLIQGALVDIRRVRQEILDLGTKHRARWFLPIHARPAYLGPKRRKE